MLAEIDQRHVQTSDIRLANGMNAFLARPDGSGPFPSMILLHERYGLVQHTKDLAVRFAAEGHLALAPNLYFRASNQDAVARGDEHVDVTDEQVCADVGIAIDHLATMPGTTRGQLAVMGVCATGRHPLVVAAERPEVTACVVFYGAAYAREWEPVDTLSGFIQRSKAPVLGVFGELDNLQSVPDVIRVRNALEAARRSYHIQIFPDSPHGWLNDTMPGRYRRTHAEAAWKLLVDFLARVYGGGYPADRVHYAFECDWATEYDFSTMKRWA